MNDADRFPEHVVDSLLEASVAALDVLALLPRQRPSVVAPYYNNSDAMDVDKQLSTSSTEAVWLGCVRELIVSIGKAASGNDELLKRVVQEVLAKTRHDSGTVRLAAVDICKALVARDKDDQVVCLDE